MGAGERLPELFDVNSVGNVVRRLGSCVLDPAEVDGRGGGNLRSEGLLLKLKDMLRSMVTVTEER